MESIPFLTIDNESIELTQALKLLRASGGFQRFLGDILRQYLLEKELLLQKDIQVDSFRVDQAIMDFRMQNQLTNPNRFRQWLATNGITYEDFQRQVTFGIKVEKLKTEVTEPKLEKYFTERKPFLDRVVLSRIILSDKELAENLKQQILEDISKFESLARKHSLTEDRVAKGMMGAISRGQLPNILKAAVDLASPGEVIGPLEIDGRYCLFRVEEFLPASLEEPLKQELQNQLFEQWLQEKLEKMTIKLIDIK